MTETQLEFSEVLDSCIEEIRAGRLTVEACLERYPEFAGELRDPLIAADMLRGVPLVKPTGAFQQQARPRLMAQLGPMPAGTVSLFEALRQKWNNFFIIPQTRRFSMAWMLALLLVGSVLIGGGTAYASDAAVPGQPLYGLDRSLEEIQSELTSDPEAFVALQLAFADERLSEAQELANIAESEGFQEALDGYGESIAAIAQEVGSAEDIDLAALGTLLDESLSNHDAKLAALSPMDEDNGEDDCEVNGEADCDENDPVDECDQNGTMDECDENGTPDNGDQDGDMDDSDKSENRYCVPGGEHPVALKLTEQYKTDENKLEVGTVMGWFCGTDDQPGVGFGQIMHALQTEKMLEMADMPLTAEQLLALKASGIGWGQIWKGKYQNGKPMADGDPEDTEFPEDDVRPEPPGQAKKSDGQVPPGQAKKADQQVPPGQAKKTDRQEPPGQAKKSDQEEPSDQDEESDQSEPPEQGDDSDNSESSEQDKKSDQQEPPGQAKKSNQQQPPAQAKKSEQQQGKKNKDK